MIPTLHNYDDNGILLKATTNQNEERLTSFDSFMQSLDDEYDKRRRVKSRSTQKKVDEVKKITATTSTTTTCQNESTALTLDGPIEYRDNKLKKKLKPLKKVKAKPKVSKKKPILTSSSSDDDAEVIDSSQMVYDEDEAW